MNAVLALIANLFAALFAPARMLARVAGMDAARLEGLAYLLERMHARGQALAYDGEDEATIAARIDYAAWLAADPWAALKHMIRTHGGLLRDRFGMVAPPADTPPSLFCAPLCAGAVACACADTS